MLKEIGDLEAAYLLSILYRYVTSVDRMGEAP